MNVQSVDDTENFCILSVVMVSVSEANTRVNLENICDFNAVTYMGG